jgi:hypothetical protein
MSKKKPGKVLRGYLYQVYFVIYPPEELRQHNCTYVLAANMHDALGKLSVLFPGRAISMLNHVEKSYSMEKRVLMDRFII